MKNKVLTVGVIVGLIYLTYYLISILVGPPNKVFIFRSKYLYYGAEWFQSKGVSKIVSTDQIGKHKFVFDKFNIEITEEEFKEDLDSENIDETPVIDKQPVDLRFIDLNKFISLANKTKSKGLYVQGEFEANEKNLKLFEDFIANNGFIYFNSPTDFVKLSESFINFLEKNVSAGSVCVLDFTKMNYKPGGSVLDNLDYLIQYKESNTNLLIKKLKNQFTQEQQGHKQEKEAGENQESP